LRGLQKWAAAPPWKSERCWWKLWEIMTAPLIAWPFQKMVGFGNISTYILGV